MNNETFLVANMCSREGISVSEARKRLAETKNAGDKAKAKKAKKAAKLASAKAEKALKEELEKAEDAHNNNS